jgi:hypothetical protein
LSRDNPLEASVSRPVPEGKVSTGGVTNDNHSIKVEVDTTSDQAGEIIDAGHYIHKCPGPATAWLASAPVL